MNALKELEKKDYADMTSLEKAVIDSEEYDGISTPEMIKEALAAATELAQLRASLDEAKWIIEQIPEYWARKEWLSRKKLWLSKFGGAK